MSAAHIVSVRVFTFKSQHLLRNKQFRFLQAVWEQHKADEAAVYRRTLICSMSRLSSASGLAGMPAMMGGLRKPACSPSPGSTESLLPGREVSAAARQFVKDAFHSVHSRSTSKAPMSQDHARRGAGFCRF